MGYRTVVILYNDQHSEWAHDPLLGQKISIGMNDAMGFSGYKPFSNADLNYGKVVECTHADTQTMGIFDSYNFLPVVHSFWRMGETNEAKQLRLLQEMAEHLGYKLVKDKK